MKTQTLKQLLLYNYRYWFAYAIGTVIVIFFMFWKLDLLGPGFAPEEVRTAALNIHLSHFLEWPAYPLHTFLQWLSLRLFGADILAVRLPSVILGISTLTAVFFAIKNWSNKAIALITAPILVSAEWFLFIARLGTGTIEFSFWLAFAILAILKIIKGNIWWHFVLTVSLIGLLFVPFGIYAVATIVACLFMFKALRERFFGVSKKVWITCLVIFSLALIGVVVIGIFKHDIAKFMLGISQLPTPKSYIKNVLDNSLSIVLIWPNSSPLANLNGIFMIRFFELAFGLLGIYAMYKARAVRVPYIMLGLLVVLGLLSGLSSDVSAKGLVLVPFMLAISVGVNYLIRRWRLTFPKNPYARIVSYVPLGMLMITVILFHYVAYFTIWGTQTSSYQLFRKSLTLLRDELAATTKSKNCLIVTDNFDIYNLAKLKNSNCSFSFAQSAPAQIPEDTKMIVESSLPQPAYPEVSKRALISERKDDNVRWYVYQK